MKVIILVSNGAPGSRDIEYFQHRLEEVRITSTQIDADSREGSALTELYDAMQRPAVIVAADNGNLIQKWEGDLPLPTEVSALVNG